MYMLQNMLQHTLSTRNPKSIFKVLIVTAMTAEQKHLTTLLEESTSFEQQNSKYTSNTLNIETYNTGIGMVNAASKLAKYLVDNTPDIIINTGCAGAHSPDINIGDVIIGEDCVSTTNVIVKDNYVIHYGTRVDNLNDIKYWQSDQTLRSIAFHSNIILTKNASIHYGRIGSSDVWLDSTERIKWTHSKFNTLCEDMEAAALAQVSAEYRIPFLSIKDISNSIYYKSKFNPYDHITPSFAGENSARVAIELCSTLNDILEEPGV